MEWAHLITALAGGILGAGGITAMLVPWLKHRLEMRKQETDGDIQRGTVVAKQMDHVIENLTNRLGKVEKAEEECQRAKEKMAMELGELRGQNRVLVRRVDWLATSVKKLQSGVVAYVQCDSDGLITEWSEGAEELLGWKADEAVGRSVEILIPNSSKTQHREAFHSAVLSGTPIKNRRLRGVFALTKTRNSIPVSVTINSGKRDGKLWFTAEIKLRELTNRKDMCDSESVEDAGPGESDC